MPNILGKMISETDLKDLGGWTEMLVDAYRDMCESGRMTGKYKKFDMGKSTTPSRWETRNYMIGWITILPLHPAA